MAVIPLIAFVRQDLLEDGLNDCHMPVINRTTIAEN
jgi:hypothetical protein